MENKQFYRKKDLKNQTEVIEVNYLNGVYSLTLISNHNKGESLAMQISHNVEERFINDLIEITEESNLSEWFAALSIFEASAIKAADISTLLSIKKLTK
jgi:hypothetical protein